MKTIIKIFTILISIFLLTSCTNEKNNIEKNEFQEIYGVETDLVKRMTYEEFLTLTEKNTGVVFIAGEDSEAKDLAQIFCDTLCECDVNKAHFVKISDIPDDKLLDKFGVESLDYPIIVAYKMGELVGYYDKNTKTDDVNKYIDDLIHEAYPTVCTDVC